MVIRVSGEIAVVQARRGQACEGCGAARQGGACACEALGPQRGLMQMRAINRAGAKEGDRVLVSVDSPSVLKVGVLLYVSPLIGLLVGALLGQGLVKYYNIPMPSELFIGLMGMVGIVFVFFMLRFVLRKLERKAAYVPVVTYVLDGPRIQNNR